MHKINTRLVKMMKAVELVIAVLLMIAIAISTLATVCFGAESLMNQSFQLDAILEKALTLVVGVEFVKMLILHTPESVIEVLLYAVARQIIISHESAMQNLVGVLSAVNCATGMAVSLYGLFFKRYSPPNTHLLPFFV